MSLGEKELNETKENERHFKIIDNVFLFFKKIIKKDMEDKMCKIHLSHEEEHCDFLDRGPTVMRMLSMETTTCSPWEGFQEDRTLEP